MDNHNFDERMKLAYRVGELSAELKAASNDVARLSAALEEAKVEVERLTLRLERYEGVTK